MKIVIGATAGPHVQIKIQNLARNRHKSCKIFYNNSKKLYMYMNSSQRGIQYKWVLNVSNVKKVSPPLR